MNFSFFRRPGRTENFFYSFHNFSSGSKSQQQWGELTDDENKISNN